MHIIVNLLVGLVFGAGLVVSGMANPEKVLNFIDVFGVWDPSLAFVMAGAIIVTAIGYRLAWRRGRPLSAPAFASHPANEIDRRIIAGPAIFGIGWGLIGFCPGPALTSLGLGSTQALIFVAAMFAGMAVARAQGSGVMRPGLQQR